MIDLRKLNFQKSDGLIVCVIQDAISQKVLMVGYMNQDALLKTLEEKIVTFYSRSKKRLWTKGETSNNFLHLEEIIPDCDSDALLIKVKPSGPVCHKGSDTCFNESNSSFSLTYLEQIILDRMDDPSPDSYTAQLIKEGINKIAQKVGEEAVELVIEAKDENAEKFVNEAADLMYHYLLLLAVKKVSLKDVVTLLGLRHQSSR